MGLMKWLFGKEIKEEQVKPCITKEEKECYDSINSLLDLNRELEKDYPGLHFHILQKSDLTLSITVYLFLDSYKKYSQEITYEEYQLNKDDMKSYVLKWIELYINPIDDIKKKVLNKLGIEEYQLELLIKDMMSK